VHWWTLWKPADEFVKKVFCRNLQLKWVTTVLDANIKELEVLAVVSGLSHAYIERQHRHIGIPVIDIVDDCNGSFSGPTDIRQLTEHVSTTFHTNFLFSHLSYPQSRGSAQGSARSSGDRMRSLAVPN
jgi:hypothetical protein